MRLWTMTVGMLGVWAGLGCGPAQNACGLKSSVPDTPSGTLQATRDGSSYTADNGLRGYRLSATTDIVAGDVTLAIGKDKDGNSVQAAVEGNKFPICILLDDQADGTGYAMVNGNGSTYLTSGSHTGTVAILAKDGNELIGRFEFEAAQNGGSGTTRFEDGSFRLGPR